MQNIIYCPICGKNIRFQKICSCCGYEPGRDYDVYPTLEKIPEGTESVLAKRQAWEKQLLREAMDELLTPQSQEKEKKKITKKDSTKEESTKEAAKTAKPTEKAARQAKKKTKQTSKEDKQRKQKYAQLHTADEKTPKEHIKPNMILVPVIIAAIALVFLLTTILNYRQSQKKNDEETSQETESLEVTDIKEAEMQYQIIESQEVMDTKETEEKSQSTESMDSNDANEVYKKVESLKVGDTFTFGAYEQDNNSDNSKEEIEWIILDRDDKSMLLVSKYALDCKLYNETYIDATWETCTLRKWLNSTFLSTAFSDEEQEMIPKVTVSADSNPKYKTDQGNSTEDQIFLLSYQEAVQYFSTDEKRRCAPTAYAVKQGAYTIGDYKQDGRDTVYWWLRSMGSSSSDASSVDFGGHVHAYGSSVHYNIVGVRPALWVNLESGIR